MLIGICDDHQSELEQVRRMLDAYLADRAVSATVMEFGGGDAMLQVMRQGAGPFDILLLDIIMPFISGIELAKEIRDLNPICSILFISSSREYGVDSYSVKALNYLVKPVEAEAFFIAMDEAVEKFRHSDNEAVLLREGRQSRLVRHRDILFIETMGHKLKIHLLGEEDVVIHQSMGEMEQLLGALSRFVRCHNAYLVNLQHVVCASALEFTVQGGARIPISRTFQAQARERYFDYLTEY